MQHRTALRNFALKTEQFGGKQLQQPTVIKTMLFWNCYDIYKYTSQLQII